MTVNLIVAADDADIIGRRGTLPWHIATDLRHFRNLTMGHTVVMGRITYEAVLARLGRPLDGRTTIVLTHDDMQPAPPGVLRVDPGVIAGQLVADLPGVEKFVAGGASVYEQLLPVVERVYLTRVAGKHAGDRKMPAGWLEPFGLLKSAKQHDGFRFETWQRQRAANLAVAGSTLAAGAAQG